MVPVVISISECIKHTWSPVLSLLTRRSLLGRETTHVKLLIPWVCTRGGYQNHLEMISRTQVPGHHPRLNWNRICRSKTHSCLYFLKLYLFSSAILCNSYPGSSGHSESLVSRRYLNVHLIRPLPHRRPCGRSFRIFSSARALAFARKTPHSSTCAASTHLDKYLLKIYLL